MWRRISPPDKNSVVARCEREFQKREKGKGRKKRQGLHRCSPFHVLSVLLAAWPAVERNRRKGEEEGKKRRKGNVRSTLREQHICLQERPVHFV